MSEIKGDVDRRVKRTRLMIREALISLIQEKGFEPITVREITERADINRSTFYFHYKDKYDLLDQSMDEMLREFAKALQPQEVMPNEKCRSGSASVSRHFEHIAENATFYKVMLGKNGLPHFSRQMKLAIEEVFYKNLDFMLPNDKHLHIPRDLLCSYVASAHFGVIQWWLENDLSYSPAYMANLLNQLIKLGPLNAAGILVPN